LFLIVHRYYTLEEKGTSSKTHELSNNTTSTALD
jgi:hypothetical protein